MAIWNLHWLVLDPLILVFLWFRVAVLGAILPSHVLICCVSLFRLSDQAGCGVTGLLRGGLEGAVELPGHGRPAGTSSSAPPRWISLS